MKIFRDPTRHVASHNFGGKEIMGGKERIFLAG